MGSQITGENLISTSSLNLKLKGYGKASVRVLSGPLGDNISAAETFGSRFYSSTYGDYNAEIRVLFRQISKMLSVATSFASTYVTVEELLEEDGRENTVVRSNSQRLSWRGPKGL